MKKATGILEKIADEVGATAASLKQPGVKELLRAVMNPRLNAGAPAVGRVLALLKSDTAD